MSGRVGIIVHCAVCGRYKKPIGRSAPPPEMVNSLCDGEDCAGYETDPLPGTLWPGETCEEFGYAHSHEGTADQTNST
jgi:hypothetical protein